MEDAYIDGIPLHLKSSSLSAFAVIKGEAFDELSIEDVQVTLENQHLVVTARETYKEPDFKKALQRLGSLDTVMTIQGMCVYSRFLISH